MKVNPKYNVKCAAKMFKYWYCPVKFNVFTVKIISLYWISIPFTTRAY